MENIKNFKQLTQILEELDKQGFSYINEYDLHNKKINYIINAKNTLCIKYDYYKITKNIGKEEDYEKIEKIVENYFSNFSMTDKIQELIQKCPIKNYIRLYISKYDSEDKKDKFKKDLEKYPIRSKTKDNDGYENYIAHDLSGNSLKIILSTNNYYEFEQLVGMFLEKDFKTPNLYSWSNEFEYGKTYYYGKLEYKFFKNGTIQIKHPNLNKLKEEYKKYYLTWDSHAIKM
jgi:hypothetical protein